MDTVEGTAQSQNTNVEHTQSSNCTCAAGEVFARLRGPGLGTAVVFMSAGLRAAQEPARPEADGALATSFGLDGLVALVARYCD